MSEIKTEIKANSDGSFTITDSHSTADIVRWLLTQDTKETIVYLLEKEFKNDMTWQGLTDHEVAVIGCQIYGAHHWCDMLFYREVEKLLKERNEKNCTGHLNNS